MGKCCCVKILYDIPIKMRDGVILYANLYRPCDDSKYPVIIKRTPYDKNNYNLMTSFIQTIEFARHGYNMLFMDIRGTHMSEGEYTQVGNEVEDGYDTVEWAAAQDWCDGRVGMVGVSAVGYTQLAAASSCPPHLCAIAPFQTSFVRFPGIYSQGIAHSFMIDRVIQREKVYEKPRAQTTEEGNERLCKLYRSVQEELVRHLPIGSLTQADMPEHSTFQFRHSMSTNLENPAYFRKVNRSEAFEKIQIPCLSLTGWYDFLRDETIHNYCQLKINGGSKACREESRLIIGPWTHGGHMPTEVDGVSFGEGVSIKGFGLTEKIIQWYDYWLKGSENEFMSGPKVHYFVMGKNQWRTADQWPPAMSPTTYYLHSKGSANSLSGDGFLSLEKPGIEPEDSYIYNPLDPVPSTTGDPFHGVIQDQRINQKRDDVLVYTSEAFKSSKELIGEIRAVIYASSSAKDTDFVCKLSDVHPDGRALNLCARLVRARFRNGFPGELLKPEKVYSYEIIIGNMGIYLPEDHRLRLEISSSLFPDADANLNTGEPLGYETGFEKARQCIFHSCKYPSALMLPLADCD